MALSLKLDVSTYGEVSSSFTYSGRTYSTYENGTRVTSYPDGSSSVRNADGSGMTVRADGSGYSYNADWSEYLMVNADGSSSQKFADGSRLSIAADGGYRLSNPDGSGSVVNADGSGYSYSAGWSSYSMKNADGSASYRYEDGSSVSIKADGSMTGSGGDYAYWKANADGSIAYAYDKNWQRVELDSPPIDLPPAAISIGSSSAAMQKLNELNGDEAAESTEPEVTFPIVDKLDDGSERSTEEDGSYSIKHIDGSVEKVDVEGVSVRTYEDGTIITTQSDGSYSTQHPDGSVEKVDATGVSVHSYADGTEVTTQTDGSYSTKHPDGSNEQGDGDGNSTRTWDDGHYSKTYSDNSTENGDGAGNSTRTWDNGDYVRNYPDYSVEKGDSSGNSIRTYDEGNYVQQFADGSVKEGDGQGNSTHTLTDGSYTQSYADGSTENGDGEGNSTRTWEDGAYQRTYSDGSVEQGDAKGNSQRTWDDGNYIRQYQDNSTESGDGAGNYTLTQPDGSFTRGYADESVETGDGKGTIVRTYKDGRVETRFEDNSVQSTDEDGNLLRTYENGSYTKEYQDGSIETGDGRGNSIHTQNDGSYSKQYNDGSSEQGDGQGNSTRSFDDGSYSKRFADKSVEKGDGEGNSTRTFDDGHYVQNFADESTKEGDGKGDNTHTQKDGSYVKQFADTKALETGDGQGNTTLTQPNGHYVTNHSDNSVEKGDGQGHSLRTWEDARFEEQFNDGSVKTGDGQGNSLHLYDDKHYIQTFADNSVENGDGYGNSLRTFEDKTYEQKRDDGSVETGDDQGNSTRSWQNGKYETNRDDGSVETGDGQGNSLRTWEDARYEQKRADGSVEKGDGEGNSNRVWDDGKYSRNYEDGSTEAGDGQGNAIRKWDDGKYEQKRDDNSVETGDDKGNALRTFEDGHYSRSYADNSTEEGDGQGNSTRTYEDESYLKKSADGTLEEGDGKGNWLRTQEDDSYERAYDDGSKETGDGQGNALRTFEDGSYIKNYDDGSVENGATDGTYYRDFGEGTYETKHADGSIEKGEGADTRSIYDDSSTRTYEDGTVTIRDGNNHTTHHADGSVEKGYLTWKGEVNYTRTWEDGSYETKSTYSSKQADAEGNVTTFRPRDGDDYRTQYANGDSETGNVEDGSYKIRFAEGGSETGNKLEGTYTKQFDWRNYETKHADGSIEVGDSYTDNYIRTYEDGSYSRVENASYYPKSAGFTEEGNADGSYVKTHSDGTVENHKADGSSVTTYKDGTVETVDAEGNYSKDWSDGSKETGTQSDEGEILTFERVYEDGSIAFQSEDGSHGESNSDGSYDHYDDQGAHYYKRINSDGSSIEKSSDGAFTSTQADGSSYKIYADRSTEQTEADGSYYKTYADGSRESGDGQGFSYIKHPDGTSERHFANGSVESKDIDGNITRTGYTLEHSDGSTETGDGWGAYTRRWENGAYTKDDGNGRVDHAEADGSGRTEYTATQYFEEPNPNGLGTITHSKEITVETDLGKAFGADLGMPVKYHETSSGNIVTTYANGDAYQLPMEHVDQSWKENYPDAENIDGMFTETFSGEQSVRYSDSSDYEKVIVDADGNQHIDYADGIALEPPLGTDKGIPVSYRANGDQISVTYADGTGYTTEAENLDLSWREPFPEGMRSFTADSYDDNFTIFFPEESSIELMTMNPEGAQWVSYRDGAYEGDKLGREGEMPASYHRDGDNVRVTYEDGSGFSTEVENVDLPLLLGDFPEHDNVTQLSSSYGPPSVSYNDESAIKYISTSEITEVNEGFDQVEIHYKDGSSETERHDGSYAFETVDGISYLLDADGNTTVSKFNETTGTYQTDERHADGGYQIRGGTETENQRLTLADSNADSGAGGDIASRYDLSPEGYDSVLHRDDDPKDNDMDGIRYSNGTYRYDLEDGSYQANDGSSYTHASDAGRIIQSNYGGKRIFDDPAEQNPTYMDMWGANGVAIDLKEGSLQMPELGVFITFETKDENGEELTWTAKLFSAVTELIQCDSYLPNPTEYSFADYPAGHGEIVQNEDGSQTLAREDGYEFTWFADGHMEGVLPNDRGSQEFFPNAEGSDPSYVFHYPDNEQWSEGAVYTRLADGSASYVDGDHKVFYPENPNEVNATTTFQQPDGSFGQSVVTRLGEEDELLVADEYLSDGAIGLDDINDVATNSLKMVQLPGSDEPIVFGQSAYVATKDESGEVTNRSFNTEYNFYETNEDGSFDLLIGSNVTLDTPEDLAELLQIPEVEPVAFAWEKEIEVPENSVLLNNSAFGNDSLNDSVKTDLIDREESAREEDSSEFLGLIETVNEDGSIDRTSGRLQLEGSDYNTHISADGMTHTTTHSNEWTDSRGFEHETQYSTTDQWGINEEGERVLVEHKSETVGYDDSGNLSISLNYSAEGRTINYRYSEKYDMATISVHEADGSSVTYRHDIDQGFGGEMDYSSLTQIESDGDSIFHRLGADNKTTYSSEEGTFTLEADGTIYSAFDDARVDTQLHKTADGEILPVETGPYTLGDDGKIITEINIEGKDVVGDVGDSVPREGDYYKPEYDNVDTEVTDIVAESMPEEFLDMMAIMGPPLMTQSLLDSGRVTEDSMQECLDEEAQMQDETMEDQGWGSWSDTEEDTQDENSAPDPDPFADDPAGQSTQTAQQSSDQPSDDEGMGSMQEALTNDVRQDSTEIDEDSGETSEDSDMLIDSDIKDDEHSLV